MLSKENNDIVCDMNKVIQLFSHDVIEDLKKEHGERLDALPGPHAKLVYKKVGLLSALLVKAELKKRFEQ